MTHAMMAQEIAQALKSQLARYACLDSAAAYGRVIHSGTCVAKGLTLT